MQLRSDHYDCPSIDPIPQYTWAALNAASLAVFLSTSAKIHLSSVLIVIAANKDLNLLRAYCPEDTSQKQWI